MLVNSCDLYEDNQGYALYNDIRFTGMSVEYIDGCISWQCAFKDGIKHGNEIFLEKFGLEHILVYVAGRLHGDCLYYMDGYLYKIARFEFNVLKNTKIYNKECEMIDIKTNMANEMDEYRKKECMEWWNALGISQKNINIL